MIRIELSLGLEFREVGDVVSCSQYVIDPIFAVRNKSLVDLIILISYYIVRRIAYEQTT